MKKKSELWDAMQNSKLQVYNLQFTCKLWENVKCDINLQIVNEN